MRRSADLSLWLTMTDINFKELIIYPECLVKQHYSKGESVEKAKTALVGL